MTKETKDNKDIYTLNREILNKYILNPLLSKNEKSYLKSGKKNRKYRGCGLYKHPFPTGTGKTTSVSLLIKDILEQSDTQKVIYIVNNKIGRDEVVKSLKEKLSSEEFDKNVTVLKSELDYLMDDKKLTSEILEEIGYKNYNKLINMLHLNSSNDPQLKETIRKPIQDEITQIKLFAKKKMYQLKKDNETNKETDEQIELTAKLQKLFPTIGLDKRVVVLTTQKFLNPLFDLNKSQYLFENEFYKGSLLVIDEFDSQKKEFLSKIIDDSLEIEINKIEFVREIFQKYNDRQDFFNKYDEVLEKNNQLTHREFLKELEEFYNEFHLKNSLFKKTDENDKKGFFNFFIPFINNEFILDKNQKIIFKSELDTQKNILSVSKKNNYTYSSDEYNFMKDIYKKAHLLFDKYIKLTINSINTSIEGYTPHYQSMFEQNLKNYLLNIFPDENITKGFTQTILNTILRKKYSLSARNSIKNAIEDDNTNRYKGLKKDLDFHEQPFNIVKITSLEKRTLSEKENNEFAKVIDYSLQTTPEMLLTYLARNFKILALSATVLNESIFENFDLSFLPHNLISKPSNTAGEVQEIERLYYEKIKDKKLEFKAFRNKDIIEDNLETLIGKTAFNQFGNDIIDKYIKKHYAKKDNNKDNEDNISYLFGRDMDFIQTYTDVFYKNDLESFLYLTTFNYSVEHIRFLSKLIILRLFITSKKDIKLVKDIKNATSLNKLLGFLSYIKKQTNIATAVDALFNIEDNTILDNVINIATTSASKEIDIKTIITKNKKLFLVSNFEYMSKGKNLHYLTVDNVEKDFEGIYIGEKTNLLVTNLSSISDPQTYKKQLMETLYKLHALYYKEIISFNDLVKGIKGLNGGYSNVFKLFKASKEYTEIIEILFTQAIGRLLRTASSQTHYVVYSENYLTTIDTMNNINNSPVIDKLIKYNRKELNKDNHKIVDLINTKTLKVQEKIFKLLNAFWDNNKKAKEEWEEVREFILKNPSVSKRVYEKLSDREKEIVNFYYFRLNVKSNGYKFSLTNEKDMTINAFGYNSYMINGPQVNMCMNLAATNIETIKKVTPLKEYLNIKEFNPDFSGEYKLLPISFINLYKGALGEKIGKIILSNIYMKKLITPTDVVFETFDYQIKMPKDKKNEVKKYIDFKFYSKWTLLNKNKQEILDKIVSKIEKNNISNSEIYIVNIIEPTYFSKPLIKGKKIYTSEDIRGLKTNKVIFITDLLHKEEKSINYTLSLEPAFTF